MQTANGFLINTLRTIFVNPLYVIFIPWQAVYTPIAALLNAPDKQKNELARTWMQQKLNELTFVGITSAIFIAATTTAFTWPKASTVSAVTISTWYGSLLLNIIAISISTQQAITLHRLSCYPDSAKRILSMLGRPAPPSSSTNKTWPKYAQVYLWQTAVILLNFGILLFLVGLSHFIYAGVCPGTGIECTETEQWARIFIGAMAGISVLTYLTSMGILYSETSKHAARDAI